MEHDLSISAIQAADYDQQRIDEAVERHFELLELETLFTKQSKVLIKPNLLMKRRPEEATTTHPNLVKAIVKSLQKRGVQNITIADSPGGLYSKPNLNGIYAASGMREAAEQTGVVLNEDLTFDKRECPEGKQVKAFTLIRPVLDADVIINVAKLKTHGMTGMSGAVKNLFGTIPGLQKPELHFRFPNKEEFGDMLIDLCLTVHPAVTFVDAVVSMEGDGPSGGVPRQTGFTFASRNPFALDVFLANFIGMSSQEIPTLQAAQRRGLSPALQDIDLLGDNVPKIPPFQKPGGKSLDFTSYLPKFLKGPVNRITVRFLTPNPVIRTKDCVGCGKCAESCPAKTITVQNGKAKIDPSHCIRCFCCHEMCPVRAIDIKRRKIFDR